MEITDMITEYETQKTLNPLLWDGDVLHPKLRVGFMKIAKVFYNFLEVNVPILDVILIGSNANYNWTSYSDIDLHVVINYAEIDDNMLLVKNYMHAKKSIWNSHYPLTYRGTNIELYAQDLNQLEPLSAGSYSVMRGEWITNPSAKIVTIDDALILQKAEPFQYEIDQLSELDPNLSDVIQRLKLRLRKFRQSGLESDGEYSIENMAYKYLRNHGYLNKLTQLHQQATMNKLSIEHVVNERIDRYMPVIDALAQHCCTDKKLTTDNWIQILRQTSTKIDPRGQWEYPGSCTLIPTYRGEITMQNVPYEVIGIDETGHYELMQPEHNYTFPGRMVFEIPHTAQWQTVFMQLQNKIRNATT
jgi:hypothetical protein